jgi:hypothetical protein
VACQEAPLVPVSNTPGLKVPFSPGTWPGTKGDPFSPGCLLPGEEPGLQGFPRGAKVVRFHEQHHNSVSTITCQRELEQQEPVPTRPLDTLDVCHPSLWYRVHSKDTLLLNAKLEEAPATNASHFMTSHNRGWSHEGKCLLVPQWRVSCLFGWWTASVMRRTWLYWVRCSLGKKLNVIIVHTICCMKSLKVKGKFYMIFNFGILYILYTYIWCRCRAVKPWLL